VVASQEQAGAQPLQITSYLQSTTEMETQANWLLANFGSTRIRIEGLEVDACSYPAAWPLVLGVNIGDVVSVQNWQLGNGGITGIFRVSGLHRTIQYGGMDEHVQGSVVLQLTWEPSSYWS
jgi:hypothetical protein